MWSSLIKMSKYISVKVGRIHEGRIEHEIAKEYGLTIIYED